MKKTKSQNNNEMVLYQTKSGAIELKADTAKETIWASQQDIARVFAVDVRTVNEHIKNIYKTKELKEKPTIRKIRIVQTEGKRNVEREINQYNLDMIIAVGYRVNSKNATHFRIWATQTLKEFLIKGFVLNKKQIKRNYHEFIKTVDAIQSVLPGHVTLDPKNILDLIKEFSSTWMSLDAYDKESLSVTGKTKKSIKLSEADLSGAIAHLRNELMKKGEATEIFAQEREIGSVEGIVGNVMQSFGGTDVYQTAEEKSAHLLYFIVKNHPFVDGNKRSGAFAFIWFLRKMGVKGYKNINTSALTTMTLLIAESKPEKKEQMVALITQMLK